VLADWPIDPARVLDLAAGSGEATLAIRDAAPQAAIDAVDPYTHAAYFDRVGKACEAVSFEDVAAGVLAGRSYTLIVCSFALHLAEVSRLPAICTALAAISPALMILTPHKKPEIKPAWSWTLDRETVHDRVRARLYQSAE
jgi:hypothetical protein